MFHNILVLTPDMIRFEEAKIAWKWFGGTLKVVYTVESTVGELLINHYDLLVIDADHLDEQFLPTVGQIRNVTTIQMLVVTSTYSTAEKAATIYAGVDEYLPMPDTLEEAVISRIALIHRGKMMPETYETNIMIV